MRRESEAELKRHFGGANPEVIDRFAPLLEQFAANLDKRSAANTTELLTQAAKQLDPNDPASPMAKRSADLAKRQESLTEQLTKQHTELTGRLDQVVTALQIAEAKAPVSKVSPIKGGTYETEVHEVLQTVAVGLGDEYRETGTVVGAVARSKNGDGVLSVRFLRPTREGDVLVAESVARGRFGRNGIYDVTVRCGDDVVAEFRGDSRTFGGGTVGERKQSPATSILVIYELNIHRQSGHGILSSSPQIGRSRAQCASTRHQLRERQHNTRFDTWGLRVSVRAVAYP
ncbi:hypothetical protein GORHZ_169_00450 [Gordonia rhizosphera NBRC 16068]|uniref:Uncharacterized protein n=1 Tax=Gordonia rhizosphera NBRC 16068 TaxID=1108045 RepID=K6X0K5_9ACTN|nr:hypothetical protein GORHZ_169_00450 [Gordonia rhizosphera NBRC 16068]